ncbi:PLP-dependent transferase [Coraliomargarita akajimensis]|uniref:Cys/Met metabolism pyridoxal-phosphate-dependent protein n=1 Tax=Coraliomargarita akajimensis (strain DSM 45221 / IAM 15411 / JCM 23193 / KCTC 12865 / 04OKA010-24) TaxID=583355 RepID=D5EK71_CORAD|nr:PLP-dependent transferase [Coraliomargarita akajimensis]ADE54820.1 Cys/Met metabolism pyridoxal-phosphate-dependent protein [Coraliomargarita akajimensis DSM 45221]
MDTLRHFPLGTRYPESPHAVVSSLPTMADVLGYEEGDSRVLDAMDSGYPRFVVHTYVQQLIDWYLKQQDLAGRFAVLVVGALSAADACDFVDAPAGVVEVDAQLFLVHLDSAEKAACQQLRKFVQHTGCGVSSRSAEDLLHQYGLLSEVFSEECETEQPLQRAEQLLSEQVGCEADDLLLCSSGMNAFYAGFRAVQSIQRERGRTAWIQLGWLYLDSGCILEKFIGQDETLERCYDVYDVDALLERIRSYGDQLAAVVVECPSNPLIRVCEIHRIAAAVREQGGIMVVDPTVASVYTVDVLPCADLLVTSLTKYAAVEGDVMIGCLVANPNSPYYAGLLSVAAEVYVPPYLRDLQRLAHELSYAPELVQRMADNTHRLCAYLKRHPAVKRIFCAGCSEHIEEIRKGEMPVGAVVSVELEGSLQKFYDTVRVMKGPSFGTRFTLLCPFMYLAHYDLVSTEAGKSCLASLDMDPDLVRISVGAEAYELIEAVLEEALVASVE